MQKHDKHNPNEYLDRMVAMLLEVAENPEFARTVSELESLVTSIKEQVERELPPREMLALTFIRLQLIEGISPSVREVARGCGATSSRTGARVIQVLIKKALLRRNGDGKLKDPHNCAPQKLQERFGKTDA